MTNHIETYLRELRDIRTSGAGVNEIWNSATENYRRATAAKYPWPRG